MAGLLGAVAGAAGWLKERRPNPWAIPTALGSLLLALVVALYVFYPR
jgi:hypothetical protein